ncbi:MAG: 1-deoxy-D-xylulose-5-phosphate reductoisomerase, partial [Candidatus Omnitrophica bacterium]|nr:1-deoxy-D-xylulose-5-phosphate reductoisomerase [Candidatus Omnitrophota bacterium]
MKNIIVLGSTGSIGQSTLSVVARFPDRFRVIGLSSHRNSQLLKKQIREFHPRFAAIGKDKISELRNSGIPKVEICDTNSGLNKMVASKNAEMVVMAISGSSALDSLLEAIRHRKTVALANKEALVMAGSIIMQEAKKHKTKIVPIDSEQSAIFQCLQNRNKNELKKIYLTASGGPLSDVQIQRFKNI